MVSIVVWRPPSSNIIINLTNTSQKQYGPMINLLYTPSTQYLATEADVMTAITTTTYNRMACLCASSPISKHIIIVLKHSLSR